MTLSSDGCLYVLTEEGDSGIHLYGGEPLTNRSAALAGAAEANANATRAGVPLIVEDWTEVER